MPGFGAVCSLVRLASWTVAPVLPRISAGSPSRPPVASLPSPSEPARGEPVDRRDFWCCRADPEGSESPFTPHRVPLSCLISRRGRFGRGREDVESRQRRRGTGWGPWPRPDYPDRQDEEATRRLLAVVPTEVGSLGPELSAHQVIVHRLPGSWPTSLLACQDREDAV